MVGRVDRCAVEVELKMHDDVRRHWIQTTGACNVPLEKARMNVPYCGTAAEDGSLCWAVFHDGQDNAYPISFAPYKSTFSRCITLCSHLTWVSTVTHNKARRLRGSDN